VTSGAFDVRPPKQERSRASLERVLEAGAAVLEEDGWEGFTIAAVIERSNGSAGLIYSRFGRKDTLFHAIYDRTMTEIASSYDVFEDAARWDGLETRELVEQAVRELSNTLTVRPRLLRVIMHRAAVDETIRTRGSEWLQILGRQFQTLLIARSADFDHPDPPLAADVVYRMAWNAFARQIMYGPTFESPHEVEWDQLVREVTRAATRYLLPPALLAGRSA
jgi:AcrR family transcriptional regulator